MFLKSFAIGKTPIYYRKIMFKRIFTGLMPLLLLNLSFGTIAFSQVKDDKEAQRERDVQIFVNRLGIGEKSKVKVQLKQGGKSVKGYISEINDDNFVVTDKKKNINTTLQYSSVKKVSKDSLGPLAIMGISLGVIFGAVLICSAAGGCRE